MPLKYLTLAKCCAEDIGSDSPPSHIRISPGSFHRVLRLQCHIKNGHKLMITLKQAIIPSVGENLSAPGRLKFNVHVVNCTSTIYIYTGVLCDLMEK